MRAAGEASPRRRELLDPASGVVANDCITKLENVHGTEFAELLYPWHRRSDWLTLQPNAHEGYVSWEKAETIRKMVNSNGPTSRDHGGPNTATLCWRDCSLPATSSTALTERPSLLRSRDTSFRAVRLGSATTMRIDSTAFQAPHDGSVPTF